MSSLTAIEWLNKLEKSIENVISYNNTIQTKLKSAMVKGKENRCILKDFDEDLIFSSSIKLDEDVKGASLSNLDNVIQYADDSIESLKNKMENKRKEYDIELKALNDEIWAVENIKNFINIWKDKLEENNSLQCYPESFLAELNKLRSNENIKRELSKIKAVDLLDNVAEKKECKEKIVLTEITDVRNNNTVVSNTTVSGVNKSTRLSFLDFTRADFTLDVDTWKNSSGSLVDSLNLSGSLSTLAASGLKDKSTIDNKEEEVEEEEEDSVDDDDPLNQAVYETDEKPQPVYPSFLDDTARCPSIENFDCGGGCSDEEGFDRSLSGYVPSGSYMDRSIQDNEVEEEKEEDGLNFSQMVDHDAVPGEDNDLIEISTFGFDYSMQQNSMLDN